MGEVHEIDQEKGGAQQPEGPVAEADLPFHQRAQGGNEIAVHILQEVEAGKDNEGPGGEGQGGIPQLIKLGGTTIVSSGFLHELAQRKDEKSSRRLQSAPTQGTAKTSPMMATLFVYFKMNGVK